MDTQLLFTDIIRDNWISAFTLTLSLPSESDTAARLSPALIIVASILGLKKKIKLGECKALCGEPERIWIEI